MEEALAWAEAAMRAEVMSLEGRRSRLGRWGDATAWATSFSTSLRGGGEDGRTRIGGLMTFDFALHSNVMSFALLSRKL